MKHLLIIRHAKSSWSDGSLADHDRPLNTRGRRDAPRMGRWLADQDLVPQLIVSSTAKRASQTTRLLCDACGCDHVEYDEDLYHATSSTCISRIQDVDDRYALLAIVAHNPGLEQLVEDLSGRCEFMSTAAIAHLTYPFSWDGLTKADCLDLQAVWRPKELPREFE